MTPTFDEIRKWAMETWPTSSPANEIRAWGERLLNIIDRAEQMEKVLAVAKDLVEKKVEPEPIRVWRFQDAPEEYRALSQHGGDEDWIAYVPAYLANSYIPWLESGSFGVCDISEHKLRSIGDTIYIGATHEY
jgi:hypothetical protein